MAQSPPHTPPTPPAGPLVPPPTPKKEPHFIFNEMHRKRRALLGMAIPLVPENSQVLLQITILLSATATEILMLLDPVRRDNGRVTAMLDHIREAQNCVRDAMLLEEIDALTPSEIQVTSGHVVRIAKK